MHIFFFTVHSTQHTHKKQQPSVSHLDAHLIRAPVPDTPYCHPKQHTRPGEVTRGRVPQQAEGILSRGVTLRGDVIALGVQGREVTRHGRAVFGKQGAVAADFSKGCG